MARRRITRSATFTWPARTARPHLPVSNKESWTLPSYAHALTIGKKSKRFTTSPETAHLTAVVPGLQTFSQAVWVALEGDLVVWLFRAAEKNAINSGSSRRGWKLFCWDSNSGSWGSAPDSFASVARTCSAKFGSFDLSDWPAV